MGSSFRGPFHLPPPGAGGGSPFTVVPPFFTVPAVTYASSPGGMTVGKFPNPRSVYVTSKHLILQQDRIYIQREM